MKKSKPEIFQHIHSVFGNNINISVLGELFSFEYKNIKMKIEGIQKDHIVVEMTIREKFTKKSSLIVAKETIDLINITPVKIKSVKTKQVKTKLPL